MHATTSFPSLRFQLIRNATIKLDYGDTSFLIDPLLAPQGAYPGFPGTCNSHLRNPLVDLPLPLDETIRADAVIVTHLHPDHWDEAAKTSLPKDVPMFAQNAADAASIRQDGFTDVRLLGDDAVFRGIRLFQTGGQHGTDQMMASPRAAILGEVSGVVLARAAYPSVYVAGDTIWTDEVEEAILRHRPDVIVLNAGYAQVEGVPGSIIMGKDDLLRAHQLAPGARIIAIHMEAVNHAMQSRQDMHDHIAATGMDAQRVLVPADGESYQFSVEPAR